MYPSIWSQLLVLPACLRIALAQAVDAEPNLPTDADYDSGLYKIAQNYLGQIPCPDYTVYATQRHQPFSEGPLKLPSQRPHKRCRKFTSPEVEKVIQDLHSEMVDPDLARLFQNAFPNTLDTTVSWHVDGEKFHPTKPKYPRYRDGMQWEGAHSFIVTGDINAEWLRDSTNQLAQYQPLAKSAPEVFNLLRGAIATQAEFVNENPYCNAFQPPPPSGLTPSDNGQSDVVHPWYEHSVVFECKYELDSLANFLSLGNQFHEATRSTSFLNARWFQALQTVIDVLQAQSRPTFNQNHQFRTNEYTFSRNTNLGTETLNLRGIGNPLAAGTGLIRSAFRPSDDATIFGYLIPSNAMMSVELKRTAKVLEAYKLSLSKDEDPTEADSVQERVDELLKWSRSIRKGVEEHGIITHPKFGKVFAYEVDGYGSYLLMDDANVPSLLSLPLLGFVDTDDPIYQNTRKMILSTEGNPYYLTGTAFSGIGGPHIGLLNAWPMSALVQAMTTDDDDEILECLERVKKVSIFGLINESVDVRMGPRHDGSGMTRSWFAWANSVYARTILQLAEKKPHLLFKKGVGAYVVGKGFTKK